MACLSGSELQLVDVKLTFLAWRGLVASPDVMVTSGGATVCLVSGLLDSEIEIASELPF